jgi:hypothetical protein
MCGGAIQFASNCKIMTYERAQTLCIILKFENESGGPQVLNRGQVISQYADKILPEQKFVVFSQVFLPLHLCLLPQFDSSSAPFVYQS